MLFASLVDAGEINQDDATAFSKFVGMHSAPCFNLYIMARSGKFDHMKDDEGFQATMRVMSAMGLDAVEFNTKSTEPLEDQFWTQFDGMYDLTEAKMKDDIDLFVTDPTNQAKVEAIMAQHQERLE